jgi:hypothetical protein
MSAALSPVIGTLKVNVNCVLVFEEEPSAVTLWKVTAISAAVTVTAQFALKPPSTVVTVMFALPADTALTVPPVETVATAVLLLIHDTLLFVASEGATVAINVSLPPAVIEVDGFKDTPVTGMEEEVILSVPAGKPDATCQPVAAATSKVIV